MHSGRIGDTKRIFPPLLLPRRTPPSRRRRLQKDTPERKRAFDIGLAKCNPNDPHSPRNISQIGVERLAASNFTRSTARHKAVVSLYSRAYFQIRKPRSHTDDDRDTLFLTRSNSLSLLSAVLSDRSERARSVVSSRDGEMDDFSKHSACNIRDNRGSNNLREARRDNSRTADALSRRIRPAICFRLISNRLRRIIAEREHRGAFN